MGQPNIYVTLDPSPSGAIASQIENFIDINGVKSQSKRFYLFNNGTAKLTNVRLYLRDWNDSYLTTAGVIKFNHLVPGGNAANSYISNLRIRSSAAEAESSTYCLPNLSTTGSCTVTIQISYQSAFEDNKVYRFSIGIMGQYT